MVSCLWEESVSARVPQTESRERDRERETERHRESKVCVCVCVCAWCVWYVVCGVFAGTHPVDKDIFHTMLTRIVLTSDHTHIHAHTHTHTQRIVVASSRRYEYCLVPPTRGPELLVYEALSY